MMRPGHRRDVRAAVASDIGLVTRAAQRDPDVLTPERAGRSTARSTSFRHAGRSHEEQDRAASDVRVRFVRRLGGLIRRGLTFSRSSPVAFLCRDAVSFVLRFRSFYPITLLLPAIGGLLLVGRAIQPELAARRGTRGRGPSRRRGRSDLRAGSASARARSIFSSVRWFQGSSVTHSRKVRMTWYSADCGLVRSRRLQLAIDLRPTAPRRAPVPRRCGSASPRRRPAPPPRRAPSGSLLSCSRSSISRCRSPSSDWTFAWMSSCASMRASSRSTARRGTDACAPRRRAVSRSSLLVRGLQLEVERHQVRERTGILHPLDQLVQRLGRNAATGARARRPGPAAHVVERLERRVGGVAAAAAAPCRAAPLHAASPCPRSCRRRAPARAPHLARGAARLPRTRCVWMIRTTVPTVVQVLGSSGSSTFSLLRHREQASDPRRAPPGRPRPSRDAPRRSGPRRRGRPPCRAEAARAADIAQPSLPLFLPPRLRLRRGQLAFSQCSLSSIVDPSRT